MYVDMMSLRKAVFTNLRPDSVAWNHGSLRSFKPGFESQPGRHTFTQNMNETIKSKENYGLVQLKIESLLEDEMIGFLRWQQ